MQQVCITGNVEHLIVQLVQEIVEPDMIYRLGISYAQQLQESIFCKPEPATPVVTRYYLLILLNNHTNKPLHEWQDAIEQHCSRQLPIVTIVLESATFLQWLKEGHLFALKVFNSAAVWYNAGKIVLAASKINTTHKGQESIYMQGLNKGMEFMAGAGLFMLRKQNNIAAFMLHQAAEQILLTLLQLGTGYYCCTHNIERLLLYAGMVSKTVFNIFPATAPQEKRLLILLQKAYTEPRYTERYCISMPDLLLLNEKIKLLAALLRSTAKITFSKNFID